MYTSFPLLAVYATIRVERETLMTQSFEQQPSFQVSESQPLIAVPLEENGRRVVRYFVDEETADRELAQRKAGRDVRHLAGVWARIDPELEWEELADELDRMRHASKPTPPIDLDV
jgi:hypothetical protein